MPKHLTETGNQAISGTLSASGNIEAATFTRAGVAQQNVGTGASPAFQSANIGNFSLIADEDLDIRTSTGLRLVRLSRRGNNRGGISFANGSGGGYEIGFQWLSSTTVELNSGTVGATRGLKISDLEATGTVTATNLVYTSGDQTIGGVKTFTSNIVGNGTANRLPNQSLSATTSKDSIVTLAMVEELYGWELLLAGAYQTFLLGSGSSVATPNSSSINTQTATSTNLAGFKIADVFNRSPMGHTITNTNFQNVPFQSGKTRVKFLANVVSFAGDAEFWYWIGVQNTIPSEFPTAIGVGVVMTTTTIRSVVHDGTTHILGDEYVHGILPIKTFEIEIEYYQGVCITKLNGVAVSTVSGGNTNSNPAAAQSFYVRTATGGTSNTARIEFKNIKYRITQS